jgi:hypothetical protein
LAKPQYSLGNGEFKGLVGEIFRQTTQMSSDLLELDPAWLGSGMLTFTFNAREAQREKF